MWTVAGLVVVAALALWLIRRDARVSGELRERARAGEAGMDKARRANEIRDDISTLPTDDLRDELRTGRDQR